MIVAILLGYVGKAPRAISYGAFDGVFEFSDIAGSRVRRQQFHCAGMH